MRKLIDTQRFNAGSRPSQHHISPKAFAKDNGGSIAHNLFELEEIDAQREVRLPHNVLSFSNTSSNDYYFRKCREQGKNPHPARMHSGLVSFFIEFLTDKDDLVLDPFAGSNTAGYIAEKLERRWIAIEIDESYANDSIIRFQDPDLNAVLNIKSPAGAA